MEKIELIEKLKRMEKVIAELQLKQSVDKSEQVQIGEVLIASSSLDVPELRNQIKLIITDKKFKDYLKNFRMERKLYSSYLE